MWVGGGDLPPSLPPPQALTNAAMDKPMSVCIFIVAPYQA
jgi:hypothetical protein